MRNLNERNQIFERHMASEPNTWTVCTSKLNVWTEFSSRTTLFLPVIVFGRYIAAEPPITVFGPYIAAEPPYTNVRTAYSVQTTYKYVRTGYCVQINRLGPHYYLR